MNINKDHTLYAHWTINQYTITFNANGGSECKPITYDYNTHIALPEPTKAGYTFDFWSSDSNLTTQYTATTMPAENVTLYAKWAINNYTLTFIFDNGNNDEVRILEFNSPVEYPKNVVKDGYTFNGWNRIFSRVPAENITIMALWLDKPTKYVEIVFESKIESSEAERIIKSYTNEEFEIVKLESDEQGETKVIIKFVDTDKSAVFVRSVNEVKRESDCFKRANGINYKESSLSSSFALLPLSVFIFSLF